MAAVCGGEVLRDVPFETFLAKLPECRRQCGDRAVLRAFHVYADNDRVAKAGGRTPAMATSTPSSAS